MTDSNTPDDRNSKPDADKVRFDGQPLPDKIGSTLRNLYDEVLNEDIPDDFLNLLRKADDKSKGSGEAAK